MRHSAILFAATIALGLAIGAGLSACASDHSQPAVSGSSASGDSTTFWTRRGYKLDWSAPDFGGPPPGSH